MFPYANTLAMASMKGAELKQLFENSVEYYKSKTSPNRGEFLHVSGMLKFCWKRLSCLTVFSPLGIRVVYDLTKPPGSRVKGLFVRDTSNPDGGMSAVKENVTYKIGMPSFIAKGGSRYAFMENLYHVETGMS